MKKVNQNKYVNVEKILTANIFEKEGKFQCAISLDTVNKEESVVWSDKMGTRGDVETFILSLK